MHHMKNTTTNLSDAIRSKQRKELGNAVEQDEVAAAIAAGDKLITIRIATRELAEKLDAQEEASWLARGFTHPRDRIELNETKKGRKFLYLDFAQPHGGYSGGWLVEAETGEIFNIKGYGVPDYNKKKKANLGNVSTADPARVHAGRWNYLR